MFPLSRFFSANRRFVGARVSNFLQYSKHSFRKFDKFVEIWHWTYFNTELVRNFGHINVFLELWAQLFNENLGTRRLAIKLEGTQLPKSIWIHSGFLVTFGDQAFSKDDSSSASPGVHEWNLSNNKKINFFVYLVKLISKFDQLINFNAEIFLATELKLF